MLADTDLQSRRIRPAPAAIRAIVMALVEGPTLMDRIARGPIPLSEGLPIAKQIAEALEAADGRRSGITHRDLKPANFKVREVQGSWRNGVVHVAGIGKGLVDPVGLARPAVVFD